ncbi:hypothetical protein M422DRAFT_259474 [Sphaerobolus stellatus SS14]|uniref:Uncharacterized protein n=1 Tax=Sphaerobolus stellatus (strain SS14) TaxID=990650 RepID=A0A0C9USS0_SPHS4|nr:hypothetical protein M422DRAFT_259474 [Sphaerobolus stellatus SS14]
MDNEQSAPMQVDPSTKPMSALEAFKMDPSTEWVIKFVPRFVTIKHKMGCTICDASASHCMAAKRYQANYYHLLEDYNVLKESAKSAKAQAEELTIQNLSDQVQSLEKELQETKDNSAELSRNEDLILENKRLKKELEYYVGRAQYALYGKDTAWAKKNGYHLSDIPASDGEDDNEDPTGLPTIPEDIPQYIPVIPPNSCARITSKKSRNDSQVVREAGIPAIGGYRPSPKQKRIVADPPASITGVLPKLLGKSRAEQWDQPAFRGTSEWILEQDIHDAEMCRLYAEAKALPPHQRMPDHTAVMFRIDEYAQSLPGLPRNLVARHDDLDWMTDVIQSLHVNVDDANVWYWVNLIKPKYQGAEAESLLQHIFSSIRRWDKLVAGRWKRNDSPFLCSPAPARYKIPHHQKLDTSQFAYWLGCDAGVTPDLAREKIEPYFIRWKRHEPLPLVQGSPFYSPPTVGEPMDQDEPDPEPILLQHTGSSSLANRLDYGEGGSFSQPPANACELWARISYFDSLVPQGTVRASMAELSEEFTCKLYTENIE